MKNILLAFLLMAAPLMADDLIKSPFPDKVVPPEKVPVKESMGKFSVKAQAPFPEEVTDEAQARNIAQNAALVWGQNRILEHVLTMKTHSGKTLEEAQIPSIELQAQLKEYAQQGKVEEVKFEKKVCYLTVVLSKSPLKKILRKN